MAGRSMNGIKSRIKSVGSTMQITKAMELVATSKLRRQKERAEASRPYHKALLSIMRKIYTPDLAGSPWYEKSDTGRTLYVIIGGDRGLAGGYNANVFRTAKSLDPEGRGLYLPIGKKALEHYRKREHELLSEDFGTAAAVTVGTALSASRLITEAYLSGRCQSIVLVYTHFTSMLTQEPRHETLLPLTVNTDSAGDPIIEGDPEELLAKAVPEYLGGVLYSAVCESVASESGARRTAMNSANKNAEQMIDSLTLEYNRARQAAITQEITEIVSGAEAL